VYVLASEAGITALLLLRLLRLLGRHAEEGMRVRRQLRAQAAAGRQRPQVCVRKDVAHLSLPAPADVGGNSSSSSKKQQKAAKSSKKQQQEQQREQEQQQQQQQREQQQ
jgi:hypothetical protein